MGFKKKAEQRRKTKALLRKHPEIFVTTPIDTVSRNARRRKRGRKHHPNGC